MDIVGKGRMEMDLLDAAEQTNADIIITARSTATEHKDYDELLHRPPHQGARDPRRGPLWIAVRDAPASRGSRRNVSAAAARSDSWLGGYFCEGRIMITARGVHERTAARPS